MTSTQEEESLAEGQILRTDSRQRVWVSRERREALLEEFEKSGASAMRFAAFAAIKYPTFANWVAGRRRSKSGSNGQVVRKEPKWLEAVVDEGAGAKSSLTGSGTLRVQLPGGAYVDVGSAEQVKLAAQLLAKPECRMLSMSGSVKVLVALEPCDLRKGFNGLEGLVSQRLGEDARSGTLYVFCNRRHNRLKILYFDGTGLWILPSDWKKDFQLAATKPDQCRAKAAVVT